MLVVTRDLLNLKVGLSFIFDIYQIENLNVELSLIFNIRHFNFKCRT